jgi:tetratricopeptide (TPR) repeat protein
VEKHVHQIGIFLGAGASWDSGLPLGDNAAKYIINSLFNNLSLSSNYAKLVEYEQQKQTKLWPRFEVVVGIFEEYLNNSSKLIIETFLDCGISSTCQSLAKIRCNKIWFTTNFDNQIELALQKNNIRYEVFVNRNMLESLRLNKCDFDVVIKLHGDNSTNDPINSLGVTIDQILRKLPESISANLTNQLCVKEFIFIGYAARDPDLHEFISKLIRKVPRLKWIDLGACSDRILKLVGRDFDYYSEGSPKALHSIFKSDNNVGPIKLQSWYHKVDKLLSTFDKDKLVNIAADLCLISNNNNTFETIRLLHSKLEKNTFNEFHIRRRKVQMWFHSPNILKNESIHNVVEDLVTLSRKCSDQILRNEIGKFIASILWRLNNPNEGLKILSGLSENLRKDSKEYVELQILTGITKIYYGSKLYEEGIADLRAAKELASELSLPIQAADAGLKIAIALIRSSTPEKSEEVLYEIKPIFDEIGDQKNLFTWTLNLAESHRTQLKFDHSLAALNDLIDQASAAEDNNFLLHALHNKGLVLTSMGKLKEGDQLFNDLINTSVDANSSVERKTNALYNRGWLRIICCSWEKAIPFLNLAAASFLTDYYSPERRGGALSLVGIAQFFLGDIDHAKETLSVIEENGIAPSGSMKSDFKLLNFLVKTRFNEEIIGDAKNQFSREPEQLFYINYMLLKKYTYNVGLIKNCMECANDAKLASYWHLIHRHVHENNILLEQIDYIWITGNLTPSFEFIDNY